MEDPILLEPLYHLLIRAYITRPRFSCHIQELDPDSLEARHGMAVIWRLNHLTARLYHFEDWTNGGTLRCFQTNIEYLSTMSKIPACYSHRYTIGKPGSHAKL